MRFRKEGQRVLTSAAIFLSIFFKEGMRKTLYFMGGERPFQILARIFVIFQLNSCCNFVKKCYNIRHGGIAQLGERSLDVREVMGSSPVVSILLRGSGGVAQLGERRVRNA